MPATKRGIYHNLKESNYIVSNGEIIFFFSSRVYLNKFMSCYNEHRETFLEQNKKIGIVPVLNMRTLADIILYNDTEKRGFCAWLKGVEISWTEIHRYALRKMTEKNTLDWYEMQKPKLEERIRLME